MGARKLFLTTFSLFSFFTLSLTAQAFTDVTADHQYAEAINYLKEQGVVQGYDDGGYRPEQTISRAEFLKIVLLVDQEHREAIEGDDYHNFNNNCFDDVEHLSWYEPYVCYGRHRDIVSGDGDSGLFNPGRNVNFAEAAKILRGVFVTSYVNKSESYEWYVVPVNYLSEAYVIPSEIQTLEHQVTRGEMA